jgi:hypothetical protein
MMGKSAILFKSSKEGRFTIFHGIIRTKKNLCFGKIGFEPSSEIQNKFLEVQTDFVKDKAMCIENNHPQKSQNSEIHPWWE